MASAPFAPSLVVPDDFPSSLPAPSLPRFVVPVLLDSCGFPASFSPPIDGFLHSAVEKTLMNLIEGAVKFLKHSGRSSNTLSMGDLSLSLRSLGFPPLFGFSQNVEGPQFLPLEDFFIARHSRETINLQQLANSKSLSTIQEPTIKISWLAINGRERSGGSPVASPPIPSEDLLMINNLTRGTMKERENGESPNLVSAPPGPALLSQEHGIFFNRVISCVLGVDERLRQAALRCARQTQEPAILTFFAQWLSEQLSVLMNDQTTIMRILQLVDALLISPLLHLDHHLHQFLPALMTTILARRLGSPGGLFDHWETREEAARILGRVVSKFGSNYAGLRPRVSKALVGVLLDPMRTLESQFGAIVGLKYLGSATLSAILIPALPHFLPLLTEALAETSNPQRLYQAIKVEAAIREAVRISIKGEENPLTANRQEWRPEIWAALSGLAPLPPQPNCLAALLQL